MADALLRLGELRWEQARAKYLEDLGAWNAAPANVRKSDAYQKAHQSVDDFVGKVDEHNVGKVCTNARTKGN